MRDALREAGFREYLAAPQFATIRAGVPEGHPLRARTRDADFVLARRDGPSTDGRRPDYVEAGTLLDDLCRRDFTVNAIARTVDGDLIDPHGGVADCHARVLRFVGDPMERIREDGLRVLRGFRFALTKGLKPEPATWTALLAPEAAEMLACVSVERVREEVEKMVASTTLGFLSLMAEVPEATRAAVFRGPLRLSATLRK